MIPMRARRYAILGFVFFIITACVLLSDKPRRDGATDYIHDYMDKGSALFGGGGGKKDDGKPLDPIYRPTPTWTPPPVQDPFPALATSTPPPIPEWNRPKKDLHLQYGLDYKPPLFIGFTRNWPMLLQSVVSYITAGWPADQIYVVENTGVQRANADGKLTLQNPYYLDHGRLAKLGVNVIRTPVLMNFAQLQNFYVYLAHEHEWPYYFWSHMDVLVLSYEDGNEFTPPASDPDYKTIYELCLAELRRAVETDPRWSDRFFAYDHLTLVNREAYDAVGGWDTFIPYYITDCDMHTRLTMQNWTIRDARAGIITDVGSALENLLALYRDPSVEVRFVDPNPPPPPPPEDEKGGKKHRRRDDDDDEDGDFVDDEFLPEITPEDTADDAEFVKSQHGGEGLRMMAKPEVDPGPLEYWILLRDTANNMFHHKHSRDRNQWQTGQQGGQGEPYYYHPRGIAEAIDVLTEAGRQVYRRKWGHRDCDILAATTLEIDDQWLVEQDWKDE